jgi:hypothetical protein
MFWVLLEPVREARVNVRQCVASNLATCWLGARESAGVIPGALITKRKPTRQSRFNSAVRQSLVAAGVDAAPTGAIVRISTQAVRLVNVIGVAVRIARVSEYPRHLACGELICLLDRHEGNVSSLSLASGDGAGQRDANRNPQTVYSSHRALLCASHSSE